MADFRRSLALAGLALALGVGTASAQGTCGNTSSAPPVLRSVGKTELVGQIVLSCSAITATNVNIVVNFPAPVAVVSSPYIIVAPGPGATGLTPLAGAVSGTTVTFNGVVVAGPTAQITIGGIRLDVSGIAQANYTPVNAQLSVSNGSLPLLSSLYTVGTVSPAFTAGVTASTAAGTNACSTTPITSVVGTSQPAYITLAENNATAFKQQQNIDGTDSETGSNFGGTEGGAQTTVPAPVATSGTELAVTFAAIPTGVTLYVPVSVLSSTNNAFIHMVTPIAAGAAAGGAPTWVSGTAVNGIPDLFAITAGTTVYYDVITGAPNSVDNFNIPVYAAGPLVPGATATVALSPALSGSDLTGIVPNFVNAPSSTLSLYGSQTVQACQSSLLFPFLTNQAGFDTGISIAYTAKDPFGTSAGTTVPSCSLNLYGASAPTTAPTLSIPVGGEGHTTISAAAPNFQGYGIAVCNFTFAHGYAFITDGFLGPGKGLSEGYVALILTSGTRPGTGTISGASAGTTAEVLGH